MKTNRDERKRQVAEYWANNPSLSINQICKNMKIARNTFWEWRKKDDFMNMYHETCKKRFAALQAIAVQKLGEQVNQGNFNAVKYVLDSQGYKPIQKIETNVPTIITVSIKEDE